MRVEGNQRVLRGTNILSIHPRILLLHTSPDRRRRPWLDPQIATNWGTDHGAEADGVPPTERVRPNFKGEQQVDAVTGEVKERFEQVR